MSNIIKTALVTLAALAIPAAAACQSELEKAEAQAEQIISKQAEQARLAQANRVIANATAVALAKTYTPTPTPTPQPKYVKVCIILRGASQYELILPRSGERVAVPSLASERLRPAIEYIKFCGD